MIESLVEQFTALDDPRCISKVEHRLVDVLVIAVCAVIAEAETFEDIAPSTAGASRRGCEASWSFPAASRRTTRSAVC